VIALINAVPTNATPSNAIWPLIQSPKPERHTRRAAGVTSTDNATKGRRERFLAGDRAGHLGFVGDTFSRSGELEESDMRGRPGELQVGDCYLARCTHPCGERSGRSSWRRTAAVSAGDDILLLREGPNRLLPLLKRFGVLAAARASAYVYSTTSDIDRLVQALVEFAR
jgi:hypothetical protein